MSRGVRIEDAAGKDVGDVRSVVDSPRAGAIALAMVRREVAVGHVVRVRVAESLVADAMVSALPFAAR